MHPYDENLNHSNPETARIAWVSGEDVHILEVAAKMWFGAIVMRCFKQSSDFPLMGTTTLPVCQSSRLRFSDQWILMESYEETVMVKMQMCANVYHSRRDVPRFLHRFQQHF